MKTISRKNRRNARRRPTNRILRKEDLMPREMLALCSGDIWPDVNNDGLVTPADPLAVINKLNRDGWGPHDPFTNPQNFWYDVNFDGLVTPVDVLIPINVLNEYGVIQWPPDCFPNQPPVAEDDFATVRAGGVVAFNLHGNDYDPDGFLDLNRTEFGPTSPAHAGNWTYSHIDGNFQFDAAIDFEGTVTIPYTVYDDDGASDSATVYINVQQAATLNIGIPGTPPQVVTPDDNDVVVMTLNFNASEALNVYEMPVQMTAMDAAGNEIAFDFGEDLEIRNVVTGRKIDADLDSNSVVTFQDFVLPEGTSTWELRVDMTGGNAGDRFRGNVLNGVYDEAANRYYSVYAEQLDGGDYVDIQPGGTLSDNWIRVAEASLTVAEKSLGTGFTVVENERNFAIGAFEARAGEAEDILLTSVDYVIADGNGLNGQNYALWVDTDGDNVEDTILEDGVAVQNGHIVFADLAGGGYVIPAEDTVRLSVHADAASSLSDPRQLQVSLYKVEGEELDDGTNLGTSQITISNVDQPVVTFVSNGTLEVVRDSTPVPSRQIVGGTSETVMRLQFHSEYEDTDVTYIGIDIPEGAASSGAIDRFGLFLPGATSPFAYATVAAAMPGDSFGARMESRQLVIPEGEDVDVFVLEQAKRDTQGGFSTRHTLAVDTVFARGDVSSNNYADDDVLIGTNDGGIFDSGVEEIVMSGIASITNANPDADGTAVPTGLSDVGQFKIDAAQHANSNNGLNDVVIKKWAFTVNATNVAIDASSFRLYNKADQTVGDTNYRLLRQDGTEITGPTATGLILVVFDDIESSGIQNRIDQGEDETFVLEMSVTNPQVNPVPPSTLQVSMQRFDRYDEAYDPVNGSRFQWGDEDAVDSVLHDWCEYPETTIKSTAYVG